MQDLELYPKIERIWADALGADKVTAQDDFFGLGGDSILVTIVTLQVEEAFGLIIGPDLLFEHSVLSEYSKLVAQLVQEDTSAHGKA